MLIRAFLLVMLASGLSRAADEGPGLAQLRTWMTGSFSSALQAAADSDYFDIRLRMTPVWEQRADGPWLYVEQALAQSQDAPYRQRLYRLRQESPTRIVSEVWQLPAPESRFVGAWRDDSLLAGLAPDSLISRRGCAVLLAWDDERQAYTGATPGEDCESSLRGATYATSQVTITADGLTSWDRGYDEHGLQVWGAVKGAYQFRRAPAFGGACCAPGAKPKAETTNGHE